VEGLDVWSTEDDADIAIVICTFRSTPVLREAAVLVVLLVEELDDRRVTIESQDSIRIGLESNCGLSVLMNRPGFRRHLAAINYGLGGGDYEHEAVHR